MSLSPPPKIPGMVLIPGGSFRMGSPDFEKSGPIREVSISPFYLQRHLVTNRRFDAYLSEYRETPDAVFIHHASGRSSLIARGRSDSVGSNGTLQAHPFRSDDPHALASLLLKEYERDPCLYAPTGAYLVFADSCRRQGDDPFTTLIRILREKGTDFEVRRVISQGSSRLPRKFNHPMKPVVSVNWYEAFAYASALRVGPNRCMRLPTEAEWERAAQGGNGFLYATATGQLVRGLTHYDRNATAIVGSYPPNPYGVYDLAGNGDQWCLDWYQNSYQGLPSRDPCGPGRGTFKVLRGGSWRNWPHYARSEFRYGLSPDGVNGLIAFRLAADVP
jgi:formylglycine-generating enzyme required for sulfatase activity